MMEYTGMSAAAMFGDERPVRHAFAKTSDIFVVARFRGNGTRTNPSRWGVYCQRSHVWHFPTRYGKAAAASLARRLNDDLQWPVSDVPTPDTPGVDRAPDDAALLARPVERTEDKGRDEQLEGRVAALESVLAQYILAYGMTEAARLALKPHCDANQSASDTDVPGFER